MKFRHTPQVFKHQPQNLRKNFFLLFFFLNLFYLFLTCRISVVLLPVVFSCSRTRQKQDEGKARISLLLSTGRRNNFAQWVTQAVADWRQRGHCGTRGASLTHAGPARPRCRTLAPTPTRTRQEGDVPPHGGRYLAGLHGTLRSEEGAHVKYSRRAATTGGGAGESDESRTLRDGIQAVLRISVGKYCPLASADCRDKRTDGFIK